MIYIFFVIIICLGLFLFIRNESGLVEINHYRVPVSGSLQTSVRMVHITDLHISPWSKSEKIKPVIERINRMEPDIIVITGDFVTHYRELIPGSVFYLCELKAKYGVFAVTGNHDYWVDADYLIESLREADIRMLIDESVHLKDANIDIIGIDDHFTGHGSIDKALQKTTDDSVKIMLCHSPDIFPDIGENDADLLFCGHTHGGQVCLPFTGAMYVPSKFGKKYARGWFRNKNTWMYVNRGLGSIFPPIRTFCKKEIALYEVFNGTGKPELVKREEFFSS